ncbi:MAG: cytochrome c3 family protein [Deltaproteobacteria bacterium]|nr:cytochrome c3 family protein [Deltaproteobacteria bacterium]
MLNIKAIIYVAAGVVVFGAAFGIGYALNTYYSPDLDPVQPINFSHKIHAGDNKIPCIYCHIYADRSRVSGVPNVQRCMGCHKIIKTDSPEIIKLTGYWERKEPIAWVKVHNLPDHVGFTHKRHIKAGLDCKLCHGDVASMSRVKRVSSLQMGWCLNCHEKREVVNGKDCWTCHQ